MHNLSRVKNNFLQTGLDALVISNAGNRRYLSGFTGTNGLLLLTRDTNFLLTDFRYAEQAKLQTEGFLIAQYDKSMYAKLGELAASYGFKKIGLEKDDTTLGAYEEYRRSLPAVEFVPVSNPCEEWRRIKSPHELDLLKRAVEIADKTFLHIKEILRAGLTESEIAFEIEFFMRRIGAEKTAFDIIVASGERSSLPHGVASAKTIAPGELVTLDFGAVYQGYHSDITRTLVAGKPTPRQEEIYRLVLKAQETVIKEIGPGLKASAADALARDIIQEAGLGENFGHGLGHGVGLDIHEGPRLSPRDDTILEPGMVVTVEPGVYISGWGGVRIEDIVLITPRGCEVLTKSPKDFSEMVVINKLMD